MFAKFMWLIRNFLNNFLINVINILLRVLPPYYSSSPK